MHSDTPAVRSFSNGSSSVERASDRLTSEETHLYSVLYCSEGGRGGGGGEEGRGEDEYLIMCQLVQFRDKRNVSC